MQVIANTSSVRHHVVECISQLFPIGGSHVRASELLGLATTRVRNDQRAIIGHQNVLSLESILEPFPVNLSTHTQGLGRAGVAVLDLLL